MRRRNFISILTALVFGAVLALAGPPSYYPAALGDFDGAADYLNRGAGLTGAADGKVGTVSFWARIDGGDGTDRHVLHGSSSNVQVYINANVLRVYMRTAASGLVIDTRSSTAKMADGSTWIHFLASWDAGNAISHVYVDDSDDKNEVANNDATIDYTIATWGIGAKNTGATPFNGAVAELYFALEYLDLSVTANRREFIDASGYPVDLGPSGYKPTGTAPILYMKTQFNNCGLNSGTGGDFTINGSPDYTVGPVPFPLTTWAPGGQRGRGGRGGRSSIHP